jgi:hypothetical protein
MGSSRKIRYLHLPGDQLSALTPVASTSRDTTSPPSGSKTIVLSAQAGQIYQIALCPLITEQRIWDTAKYFAHLYISPVDPNYSPDTAEELVGTLAGFSGNLRTAPDGLWWKWTAPRDGRATLELYLQDDPLDKLALAVYRRDETNNQLIPIDTAYSDLQGHLLESFETGAGATYLFRVFPKIIFSDDEILVRGRDMHFSGSLGVLRNSTDNDNFANREMVTAIAAVLVADTTNATREPGEPNHSGIPGLASLWWEWTAPNTGDWFIDAPDLRSGQLLIGLYRGSSLSTLTPIIQQRNLAHGSILFHAVAGEKIEIALDRLNYPGFPFMVNLLQRHAPANDNFANAKILAGLALEWTDSNVGATSEPGEPSSFQLPPAASVWWRWTSPSTGPVTLTVGDATVHGPVLPGWRFSGALL